MDPAVCSIIPTVCSGASIIPAVHAKALGFCRPSSSSFGGIFNFLPLYWMVPPEIAFLFLALRNQHRREKNDTILPLLLVWLPARHSNSAPSQQKPPRPPAHRRLPPHAPMPWATSCSGTPSIRGTTARLRRHRLLRSHGRGRGAARGASSPPLSTPRRRRWSRGLC